MEINKLQEEERKRRKKRNGWIVFSILVLIRFFVVEHFMVPSSSMTPSLITGDIIFIKKYSYSWSRKSLPMGGFLPFWKHGLKLGEPKRGDCAVFTLKRDPSTYYVKRVVAIEGDTVQMRNGVLHINGQSCKMELMGDYTFLNDNGDYETGKKYKITMPFTPYKEYFIYRNQMMGEGLTDNTNEHIVPKGHVWMQGDYNTGSADSFSVHFMGPIPAEDLVGIPFFVLYNTNSRLPMASDMISWVVSLPWRILIAVKETNFNRFFVMVR